MKIHVIALLLCMVPCVASSATGRDGDSRVGVNRVSMAGARSIPNMTVNIKNTTASKPAQTNTSNGGNNSGGNTNSGNNDGGNNGGNVQPQNNGDCRAAYRACMDEFCLLDESEGYRCACSDNINKSKDLIQEIQKIQSDADKLYTEGVEREQLGAKATLVFGQSDAAKKSSRASGLSFSEWLNSGSSIDDESLGADSDIGDNLYAMASNYCEYNLQSCATTAEMEEALYLRQVVADCKSFESYLAEQKLNAESNKRTAEAAVRKARLEMLDTTNKYNRGECLLAYRSCVADKGGCGVNFENCLDVDLLGRRANACENVLDQCMAVRSYVLEDWNAEAASILVEAEKYADKYARQTCLARIQACLEDNCSTATNSACLTDIKVAEGICPVITECENLVPGTRASTKADLGYLRTQFCQNDVDKCLQDKCGQNFTAPECLGKKVSEIAELCPQSMFPSCRNETQFDIILSSVLMQMDYRLMQNCLNYFSEQLGRVCGTDMSCIPVSELLAVKNTSGQYVSMAEWVDLKSPEGKKLQADVYDAAQKAVDNFFADFEKDLNVSACKDTYGSSKIKIKGRNSLIENVYTSAKSIAYQSAKNRADRELVSLMNRLKMEKDTDLNQRYCLKKYQEESKPSDTDGSYSYIRSVSYEPALSNCHICRMQRVCEVGGENKKTSGAKGAAGGVSAGAAVGTMVAPGWGTAIGAVVGGVGGLIVGRSIGDEKEFCQEIESCEDMNVGHITEEMLKDL